MSSSNTSLTQRMRAAWRVLTAQDAPAQERPEQKEQTAEQVGLTDAVRGGWFVGPQLFPGFSLSPDDVFLDAGCGSGEYAVWAGGHANHIAFFDLDADCVSATAARVRKTNAQTVSPFYIKENAPLPIPDDFATKIICCEVLEHVDDPLFFVKELVRVARSGAQFLITVPDPLSESVQRAVAPKEFFIKPQGRGEIRGLCPGHLRTFERDEFAELLEGAGLQIESTHGFGFYWATYLAIFWACDVDFRGASHPALSHWQKSWRALLETPNGETVKHALDAAMPKSQLILARKP